MCIDMCIDVCMGMCIDMWYRDGAGPVHRVFRGEKGDTRAESRSPGKERERKQGILKRDTRGGLERKVGEGSECTLKALFLGSLDRTSMMVP